MIEMKVAGIALDAVSRSPIVLLKDSIDSRALPIYISQDQARAIMSALEDETPPRPLTHDLLVNILDTWDLNVERVVIHTLQDSTFYAVLTVVQGKNKKEIDCRPSDAIAIALRADSPIWVMEEVVADASIPVDREADQAEQEEFRNFLANVSPNDLIKNAGLSSNDAS
ncbi:MAG: bifunctional nuclease family protein [Synechococcaceae cyanobacterium RL_1_2]|jgi:bifunctional DNase/RNase|nr:bifunctional nuclease family protein [Synechococcaceae cyanobacterium RL_1_2]